MIALRYTIDGVRHYVVDTNHDSRMTGRYNYLCEHFPQYEPRLVDVQIVEMAADEHWGVG